MLIYQRVYIYISLTVYESLFFHWDAPKSSSMDQEWITGTLKKQKASRELEWKKHGHGHGMAWDDISQFN